MKPAILLGLFLWANISNASNNYFSDLQSETFLVKDLIENYSEDQSGSQVEDNFLTISFMNSEENTSIMEYQIETLANNLTFKELIDGPSNSANDDLELKKFALTEIKTRFDANWDNEIEILGTDYLEEPSIPSTLVAKFAEEKKTEDINIDVKSTEIVQLEENNENFTLPEPTRKLASIAAKSATRSMRSGLSIATSREQVLKTLSRMKAERCKNNL